MDSKKACDKESISNLRLAAAVFAGAELKACRVLWTVMALRKVAGETDSEVTESVQT
jgi:hypothetical protein